MPTTRRSARVSAQQSSSPVQESASPAGTKRKTDATGSSPVAKRGKKNAEKTQQTIEDTMDVDTPQDNGTKNEENTTAETTEARDNGVNGNQSTTEQIEQNSGEPSAHPPAQPAATDSKQEQGKSEDEAKEQATAQLDEKKDTQTNQGAQQQTAAETSDAHQTSTDKPAEPTTEQSSQPAHQSETKQPQADKSAANDDGKDEPAPKEKQSSAATTNGSAVEPQARDDDIPSSILEKGVIYFFFRARVNISDPQDVNDIARSYFVLRPIPTGAKLGDGTIGDDSNCRLIALPKKVFPKSGKDKFMSFVEKAKSSFKELKDSFMSASDYATKTAGTSHTPPVTPLAEGVYAITTTGRESHLAYMLTIPAEIGEVQKDIGLDEQGSFVVSAKNPKFPGPANTNIGGDPGYSEEIMSEFRDLRWMPLQPKLLDYVNTQFLLIGESLDNAVQELPRDEKKDTETPKEEMEKLEGEDEIRVKNLKGDDAVFADLGLSKKEYPSVPSTWA